MMKTNLKTVLLAAAGALSLGVGSAQAAISLYAGQNELTDTSGERQFTDGNQNGLLDVGDTLRGSFNFDKIKAIPSGNQTDLGTIASPGAGLEGVFEATVVSKTYVGDFALPGNSLVGSVPLYSYVFGPSAGFEADYGTGAVIAIYEDATPDWSSTQAPATAEANAENDGSLWMTVGFAEADDVWGIMLAPEDVSLFQLVPLANQVGQASLGLSILTNNTGYLFNQVAGGSGAGDGAVDLAATVSLYGTCTAGSLSACAGVTPITDGSIYDVRDLMVATVNVIPEPTTLALMGIGLLGLGAMSRRRKAA